MRWLRPFVLAMTGVKQFFKFKLKPAGRRRVQYQVQACRLVANTLSTYQQINPSTYQRINNKSTF